MKENNVILEKTKSFAIRTVKLCKYLNEKHEYISLWQNRYKLKVLFIHFVKNMNKTLLLYNKVLSYDYRQCTLPKKF